MVEEAIEQWARDVNGAQTKVAAILAEYELRGLEPPPLETVPGWQLITEAALGAVTTRPRNSRMRSGGTCCPPIIRSTRKGISTR
jgi:hypothetical protein